MGYGSVKNLNIRFQQRKWLVAKIPIKYVGNYGFGNVGDDTRKKGPLSLMKMKTEVKKKPSEKSEWIREAEANDAFDGIALHGPKRAPGRTERYLTILESHDALLIFMHRDKSSRARAHTRTAFPSEFCTYFEVIESKDQTKTTTPTLFY